jgi:hypothetical protein
MFESTQPNSYGENRKANIKNHNLPILQFMYMGDANKQLECLVTKTPGFLNVPDLVTGNDKLRFRLDFNHIRQQETGSSSAGYSVDKGYRAPSGIFRETRFDDTYLNYAYLYEFMCIMPICTEYHSYISQDSQKGDITLVNYKKEHWSWVLQNKKNYDHFCKNFKLNGISYQEIIDHLSDINHAPLHDRLVCNHRDGSYQLK